MKEYWCWWLHRYLYLVKIVGDKYILDDICDVRFEFAEEQFNELEER